VHAYKYYFACYPKKTCKVCPRAALLKCEVVHAFVSVGNVVRIAFVSQGFSEEPAVH
jgi:hypothetical protein